MTEPNRIKFNSLEQVISTDLNRVGGMAGKAAMDCELARIGGADLTVTPASVVRRGLNAAPGVGLQVVLGPGEFMRYVAGASTDQSQYKLGENDAFDPLVIGAPAGQPRIDRISAANVQLSTESSTRNQLTLPARTVSPVSIDKRLSPDYTPTVTPGVPAAVPLAPATPGIDIPLWDVLVPVGAININANHLMDLRRPAESYAIGTKHGVEHGLEVGTGGIGLLAVASGRCIVSGRVVTLATTFAAAPASYVGPLDAALGAYERRYVYLVAPGPSSPLGKNVNGGLGYLPVISTIVPGPDGRPSAAINYNPLLGMAGIPAGLYVLTTEALFIGAITTDAVGAVVDTSPALSPNVYNRAIEPSFGGFGAGYGHVKKPLLKWINATTLEIKVGALVMFGTPVIVPSTLTAVMPANLASNDGPALLSTWYYVYVRAAITQDPTSGGPPVRRFVPIFSKTAPTPQLGTTTPEPGFAQTDYVFVGSVYRDGAGNFVEFQQDGCVVLFVDPQTLMSRTDVTLAVSPARNTVTALAPRTSRTALVMLSMALSGTPNPGAVGAASAEVRVFKFLNANPLYATLRAAIVNDPVGRGVVIVDYKNWGVLHVPINGSGAFEVDQPIVFGPFVGFVPPTGFGCIATQVGYIEDPFSASP